MFQPKTLTASTRHFDSMGTIDLFDLQENRMPAKSTGWKGATALAADKHVVVTTSGLVAVASGDLPEPALT